MIPKLLHIYSDLYINSYGLAIAVGVGIFTWCLHRDIACKKLLNQQTLYGIIQIGFLIALGAGRLGALISSPDLFDHWYEWFMLWKGGFSLLGSILGILVFLPWYIKKLHIPLLPFLDRVALFAPLLQAVARIGCFLAGCCSGKATDALWGVIYTHPDCTADLYIPLHPTQLYSASILLGLFLLLYFYLQHKTTKAGQILYSYLLFMSLERFCVDFFRADQQFFNIPIMNILSLHQMIALLIFVGAGIALLGTCDTLNINALISLTKKSKKRA